MRSWLPALASAAALLLVPAAVAQANTYPVNDTGDSGDGVCDATCTLRDAVTAANASPGDDVVQIVPGTYKLDGQLDIDTGGKVTITSSGTRDNTFIDAQGNGRVLEVFNGASAEVDNATLRNGWPDGDGGAAYVDSGGTLALSGDRVTANEAYSGGGIYVDSGTLSLSNTVLDRNTASDGEGGGVYQAGGSVTVDGSSVTGNFAADGDGGGLYVGSGGVAAGTRGESLATLTITNSHVDGNSAYDYGGAMDLEQGTISVSDTTINGNNNDNRTGGAIYNNANLTLTRSQVNGNSSYEDGGGVYNDRSGTLDASFTTFNGNYSNDGGGGGIYNAGTTSLSDGAVSGNWTPYDDCSCEGGGIYNTGPLTVDRMTIDNNTAHTEGGGIYNNASASDSGAKVIALPIVSITNSTISDNIADNGYGGGIDNDNGEVDLLNDTIAYNQSTGDNGGGGIDADGTFKVKNTIIAMNTADGTPYNCDVSSNIIDQGNNLESSDDCSFDNSDSAAGDIQNTDPKLGPLANNGGPNFTRAIDTTSAAYNAADNSACPATDQRGVTRPQFGVCDIGAFELAPAPPPPAPPAPAPVPPTSTSKIPPTIAVAGVRRACTTSSRVRVRITIKKTSSPVKSVKVTLDGRKIKTTTRSRFTLVINAKRLKAGRHRLVITATDTAGNRNVLRRTIARCAAAKPRRHVSPRFTG